MLAFELDAGMTRPECTNWQRSARYVALASWALAAALTVGMGWQAWTAVQDTTGPSRYDGYQVDTSISPAMLQTAARIVANKNRAAS